MNVKKKNKLRIWLAFLLCLFSVSCGKEGAETAQEEKAVYRDIMVEREDFPDVEAEFQKDGESHVLQYLGAQFLGEEPIQLWAERYASGDLSSIYLWRTDGSRELLSEGVTDSYTRGGYNWYLSREGCFYLLNNRTGSPLIRKLDAQGKELYAINRTDATDWDPRKLCQAPDNRLYLMVKERDNIGYSLAELDPDTGTVTILEQVDTDSGNPNGSSFDLGVGMNGPAVCRMADIREVDPEQGEMTEFLSFNGTSYTTFGSGSGTSFERIQDFRIAGEGCVDILRSNEYGSPAYVERLRLEEIRRTPVVLCAPAVYDWMKRQVMRFNQENEEYYIVIEEFGLNDGIREEEYQGALEDYARRVSIQVAAGKGPDILVGDRVLEGNVWDMIEKGALEDLRPYMERTGIREEDYFPMAFNAWRSGEGIYGVCANPYTDALEADRSIIGDRPDIEGILEALLSKRDKAVYLEGDGPRDLLRLFLEGSETLWGMVDWEAGTCDFGGELFAGLLEAARRYGDTPANNYQRIAQRMDYSDFYKAPSPSELEGRGLSLAGWLFDDGCHMLAEDDAIAINAGSAQKEGAWEFIRFLLGEEAQEDVLLYPVKRDTFVKWADRWLDRTAGMRSVMVGAESRITGEWETVRIYTEADRELLETEKLPYFKELLEGARYLPIRPAPVLDIVCEEAEAYFNGSKSVGEVVGIVENRVRLYLDER